MAVVGIDLGTTNTVIAAVRDGRAAALKDQLGRALLPSAVSFPPKGEAKVGQEAKDRRTIDPENTVFSIKRLIGRTWDSEQVKRAVGRFPFQLKEGPGKGVLVSCRERDYTLPEISALVLGRAREIAEARLGRAVSDAVITVPANFNDLQRAATKVAGRTAGLQVLRILNEPTAAALAYGFGKKGRERIAVYDFGGGTFDVTLLDLSENVFEVLATAGDTFLGGDDLDESIAERMGEQLMSKHRIDMTRDPLVREQLRAAAEKLKIELSTRSMATLHVPDVLGDGAAFEFSMRRSEFEKLAEPYIVRTLEVCQQALDVASVGVTELDQVLLVGGSTRIPLVRRRISSFFGKMPQSRINPDEVVAIGAAIQAAALESKMGVSELPGPPGSVPPTGRTSAFPASPGVRTGTTQTDLGGLRRPPGTTQTGLAGLKKTLPGTTTSPLRPSTPPRTDAPRPMQSTLSGVGSAPPPALGQELPGAQVKPAAHKIGPLAQTLSGVGEFTQLEVPRTERGIGPGNAPPPKTVPGVGRQRAAEPLGPRTLTGIGTAPTGAALASLGRAPTSGDDFDDVTSVMQSPAGVAPRPPLGSESHELGGAFDPAGPAAGAPRPPLGSEVDDSTLFGGVPDAAPIAPAEDGSVAFDLGDLVASAEAELAASQADDAEFDLPAPAAPRALAEFDDEPGLPVVSAGAPEVELVSLAPDEDITDLPARSVPPPADDDVTDLPALSRPPPRAFEPDDDEPALPARSEHPPAPRFPGLPAPTGVGLPARAAAPLPAFAQPGLPAPGAVPPVPAAAAPARAPRPFETTQASPGFAHQPTLLEPPGGRAPHGPASMPPSPALGGFDTGVAADRLRPTLDDAQAPYAQALHTRAADAGPPRAPLLLDVTPLSLGVETVSGFVDTLIERNSPIPCERTRTFATARDSQTVVRIRVSQGNANRFADNTVLGEVELPGIAPGPRGSVKVDVTFALDESGMLHVSARDRRTGLARDAHLRLLGIEEPR